MSWQPTEGLMRAAVLVYDLEQAALAAHHPIVPILRFRMTEVIAKALDQALADGAERVSLDDALDKVVGSNGNGHADPDAYSELQTWGRTTLAAPMPPATADPVGMDPEVLERVKSDSEYHDLVAMPLPYKQEDAPKKKRGRPKGAKGKKAKPAKAAKAIKAAAFEEPSEVEYVAPEAPVERPGSDHAGP